MSAVLLWVAAAVLAALGGWLLLGGGSSRPDAQHRAAPPPAVASADPAAAAPPAAPRPVQRAPSSSAGPTGRGSAASPPSPTASSASGPVVDELAGDPTDQRMQQLLEHASPTNLPGPLAATTTATAWQQLQADLAGSRWTQLHPQAAVARTNQAGNPRPAIVDVTVLWSGTNSSGDMVQRRRNVVRLSNTNGTWRLVDIT